MRGDSPLRLWPWLISAIPVMLALSWSLYARVTPKDLELNGTLVQNPPNLNDIALVGDDGKAFELSQWRDKLLLVFFGYTQCPDVCTPTMARLASTYERLGEPEGVQVIMISVDPERDVPERMKLYVQGFHPDFVGLTGSPEAIAQAAARFYIGHTKQATGLVNHSSSVLLLDREGRMRAVYNQDKLDGMLEDDLKTILARGTW